MIEYVGFFLYYVNVTMILECSISFGEFNMVVSLSITSNSLLLTLTFISAMDEQIFSQGTNADQP